MKVLVCPQAYPESTTDIKGVFIRDYASTVTDNCNVTVFVSYLTDDQEKTVTTFEDGIQIVRMYIRRSAGSFGKLLAYLRWFFKAYFFLRKNFSDVQLIHTHGGSIPGVLTTFFSRRQGIPNVITHHSGPFSKISGNIALHRICKYAMENSAATLPVSHDLAQQIRDSGINPRRVEVFHNPVDTDLFKPAPKARKEKQMLFVGRLEDYKGALRAVKAFEQVRAELPGWRFKIIGDGPELPIIQDYVS